MKKKVKNIVNDVLSKFPSSRILLLIIISLIAAVILYSIFLLSGAK